MIIGGLIGLTLVNQGLSTILLVALIVLAVGIVLGVAYDAIVILPTQGNGPIAAIAATVEITLVFANGGSSSGARTASRSRPCTAARWSSAACGSATRTC